MEKNIISLTNYLITKGVNSPLKLQKILFFIRFEELKNKEDDVSFFNKGKNFQAWIYGPVSKEAYEHAKKMFSKEEEKDGFILSSDEIDEIDKKYKVCFEEYNKFSPKYLVDLSHKNLAWKKARGKYQDDKPCNNYLIENEDFLKFEE